MEQHESQTSNIYRIRVKETLGSNFNHWMDNLTIIPQENGETLLVGCFHRPTCPAWFPGSALESQYHRHHR